MFRRIVALCLMLIFCIPAALADRYAPYEFDLDYIPRWGEGDFISGTLYSYGERCEESGLCVKLFLQVEGSDQWWPKPTAEQSWVPVEDTLFLIPFNTGGDDVHATRLALMLVREADAGLLDYAEANAAALCVTTVERTPEGEITLAQSYRADEAWLGDIGMNVDFYTRPGTAPGSELTEAHLESILRAAAAYTEDVRFYTTTGEAAKAYPLAQALGLRVAATAWLDGSDHDREELDALIALCNDGLAATAIVGSETLHAGRLTEEALIEDIAYVRAGIADPEIPVTTADTPQALLDSPALRDACDVLAVNLYPFWNGLAIDDAQEDLDKTMEALIAAADGKKIIVSETGWPSEGADNADLAAQAEALNLTGYLNWHYYENVSQVYWFSLADQPWKEADEPGVGAHWGMLDGDLNAKSSIYEYYWSWSPDNDFDTELPPVE